MAEQNEKTTDDVIRFERSHPWPDVGPWLVGVDGSDFARHALDWALANAPGRASEIRLVTAWQPPIYGLDMMGAAVPAGDLATLEQAVRDDLERLADEVRTRVDVAVEPFVLHGAASGVLLDASEDAALVVVGNRGRGGFARLLLGATSSQCAAHAKVPTAVVPAGAALDGARRILVGLDGSASSLAALYWALGFADTGATVDVTWVWESSPLAAGADDRYFPDAAERTEQRFERLLEEVATGPEQAVSVEHHFVRGRPRPVLAEAAQAADLVVLGARGYGAVGAALLGSVSTWMLHHVDRPIVVVPDGD